ncbi:polysaccharide biosynthesis protein [Candidatus Gracilibacteria bacterium]|nr:polysaccharide biosynthesis protein [Candidatus Gracilibacteria bacterium]
MIPKTIHYCWFGKTQKNELILSCIASWRKLCPDFVIKEWNEENFNTDEYPFTKKMYSEKKWAFVADYVRLVVLEEDGGFYLDTDMLLLQSLDSLTNHSCVLGEENQGVISAGMIGSEPHNLFISTCKSFYDENEKTITIPRALSFIYKNYPDKDLLTVLPPKTFYPYDSEHIKEWHGQNLGKDVMGIHLWNYSWGHPINKFFKKIGIYSLGKKVTEKLGIKELLKKLFGFI